MALEPNGMIIRVERTLETLIDNLNDRQFTIAKAAFVDSDLGNRFGHRRTCGAPCSGTVPR